MFLRWILTYTEDTHNDHSLALFTFKKCKTVCTSPWLGGNFYLFFSLALLISPSSWLSARQKSLSPSLYVSALCSYFPVRWSYAKLCFLTETLFAKKCERAASSTKKVERRIVACKVRWLREPSRECWRLSAFVPYPENLHEKPWNKKGTKKAEIRIKKWN